MSDDIQRFNVMPKRPLSVEDTGENNEWWSGRLGYLPKDHWVEVSEPITWDGKRETWDRITDLLPARYDAFIDECFSRVEITYGDEQNAPIAASIPFGNRFIRFGDSFAILPPEATP